MAEVCRPNLSVGSSNPDRMTVRNSEISDSPSWDIRLDQGDSVTENNTYSNDADGDIRRPEDN